MGIWSYYFFAKLFLLAGGMIGFHVLWNLLFAVTLAWPLRSRRQRLARTIVAVPLGLALLYHDSWLPPLSRLQANAANLQQFSLPYLIDLLGRFINPAVLAELVGVGLLAALLGRELRLASFAVAGILLVPPAVQLAERDWSPAPVAATAAGPVPGTVAAAAPLPAATPQNLEAMLNDFRTGEAQRRVGFPATPPAGTAFDVIVLHICSLAWDDMDYAGHRDHPLMSRFDVQLRNFGSAASYSGPAAIRLLRSGCGQQSHEQLYKSDEPECHLFNGLQNAGFEPQLVMNHDGHFGDFLKDLSGNGGLAVALRDPQGLRVQQHAFDGSPIYEDYDALQSWWQQRQQSPAPRVALYYNSISLHDGNIVQGVKLGSIKESYRYRLDKFLGDIDRFLELIKASGRAAVVVFVPEHGAAARGDRMQISGLREIPSPAVSLIPVGVKLVNLPQPPASPQVVDKPTSLFALASLLSAFTTRNPFEAGNADLSTYTAALPETAFVSENEGTVVMRYGNDFWMRTPDGSWSKYPAAR